MQIAVLTLFFAEDDALLYDYGTCLHTHLQWKARLARPARKPARQPSSLLILPLPYFVSVASVRLP